MFSWPSHPFLGGVASNRALIPYSSHLPFFLPTVKSYDAFPYVGCTVPNLTLGLSLTRETAAAPEGFGLQPYGPRSGGKQVFLGVASGTSGFFFRSRFESGPAFVLW